MRVPAAQARGPEHHSTTRTLRTFRLRGPTREAARRHHEHAPSSRPSTNAVLGRTVDGGVPCRISVSRPGPGFEGSRSHRWGVRVRIRDRDRDRVRVVSARRSQCRPSREAVERLLTRGPGAAADRACRDPGTAGARSAGPVDPGPRFSTIPTQSNHQLDPHSIRAFICRPPVVPPGDRFDLTPVGPSAVLLACRPVALSGRSPGCRSVVLPGPPPLRPPIERWADGSARAVIGPFVRLPVRRSNLLSCAGRSALSSVRAVRRSPPCSDVRSARPGRHRGVEGPSRPWSRTRVVSLRVSAVRRVDDRPERVPLRLSVVRARRRSSVPPHRPHSASAAQRAGRSAIRRRVGRKAGCSQDCRIAPYAGPSGEATVRPTARGPADRPARRHTRSAIRPSFRPQTHRRSGRAIRP